MLSKEVKRLKKLRKCIKNFVDTYNMIRPQLDYLKRTYLYIDELLKQQNQAVKSAKERGVEDVKDMRELRYGNGAERR